MLMRFSPEEIEEIREGATPSEILLNQNNPLFDGNLDIELSNYE